MHRSVFLSVLYFVYGIFLQKLFSVKGQAGLNWHALPALNLSLPAYKFTTGSIQPSFLVYRLLLASKALLMWVRKDKQICIQTNTHTFPKTILVNQASCGHAPGLKNKTKHCGVLADLVTTTYTYIRFIVFTNKNHTKAIDEPILFSLPNLLSRISFQELKISPIIHLYY